MVASAGYANHRVFKVGAPAVVTRGFVHAGVAYKAGDVFPYAELKLTALELYGLWLATYVDTRPAASAPIQMSGVASQDVADRIDQAERKHKRRWR